jgi:hypothetical protein
MSDQPDLLEEVARVYARAAVDEFLALLASGNFDEAIQSAEAPSDSDGCKMRGDPTHEPIGRNP